MPKFENKPDPIAHLTHRLESYFSDFCESEITRDLRKAMKNDPGSAFEMLDSKYHIKNINFDNGRSLDYSNDWICQQYMLRYSMAYTFEYYVMYLIALNMLEGEDTADIYSFGCGPGLDWLSLFCAKEKLNVKNVRYRGIDLTEWSVNYRSDPTKKWFSDAKIYHGKNMMDLIDLEYGYSPNVLFFPKILSELDTVTAADICSKLKGLNREKIILCVSYRSPDTKDTDEKKTGMIIEALEENGYKHEKLRGLDRIYDFHDLDGNLQQPDADGIFEFAKGTEYKNIDSRFNIPGDIWNAVGMPGIRQYCKRAKDDPSVCEKCDLSSKCPHSAIANTDSICFRIAAFTKLCIP